VALIAARPELAAFLTPSEQQAQHPAASVEPVVHYRYHGPERILLPDETIPTTDVRREYIWTVIEDVQ
jgi:hypothetical protein